jgi:hypothetical protein
MAVACNTREVRAFRETIVQSMRMFTCVEITKQSYNELFYVECEAAKSAYLSLEDEEKEQEDYTSFEQRYIREHRYDGHCSTTFIIC